jgi:hypothetical protein
MPWRIASVAESRSPWPVMMITSTSGKSRRIARINSWPRKPGIARSSVTTSTGDVWRTSSASAPFETSVTA